MEKYFLVLMVTAAGAAIALQSITNSKMGQITGVLEASFISFGVGTIVAALLLVAGVGRGNLAAAAGAPWYLFIGGAFGLSYVFAITRSAPAVGVTAAMAAGIAGQLIGGIIFDHFGLLGARQIPFDIWRALGVILLLVALRLILR